MKGITGTKFAEIRDKYGHCSSWAVWAEAGDKAKSNIDDLSIFDPDKDPKILEILNPEVVFVGLNISRKIPYSFGNFHDSRRGSEDYKIRYAFNRSKYRGAYMTDIIKDFEQRMSGDVKKYLEGHPQFEADNINAFVEELNDIGAANPQLIVFGDMAFEIINRHLGERYHKILKIRHYSGPITKEDYAQKVLRTLGSQ